MKYGILRVEIRLLLNLSALPCIFAENFGNLILNIEFSERCEYLPSCCNNEIHNIPSLTHIRILMNNEAHSQNFEDCFDCKND